ncbi:probable ribonuclease ZC3H12D [Toxorhynchites rutilus septentrionalis]|uniref:probable ribonuclease ZC3H12D n=1 Tax=Toxorhynchites rutilus septentrionalis TaxID=329112 RepID=UPI0024791988|nr:probable ribonuclease ZC3H12D [Toxorhynchites rutilus septentrionalis]
MKTPSSAVFARRVRVRNPIRRQSRNPRSANNPSTQSNRQLNPVASNRRLVQAVDQRNRRRITDQNIPIDQRRPVICDGESIAYDAITQQFDAKRVQTAVDWFQNAGHQTTAFIPKYLRGKASNAYAFDNLYNNGKMIEVDCSTPGTAEMNVQLEAQMLQKAVQDDAAVLSEREFRQSYHENSSFHPVIEQRVIGFCFFKSAIFIPTDPYGRRGANLIQILRK